MRCAFRCGGGRSTWKPNPSPCHEQKRNRHSPRPMAHRLGECPSRGQGRRAPADPRRPRPPRGAGRVARPPRRRARRPVARHSRPVARHRMASAAAPPPALTRADRETGRRSQGRMVRPGIERNTMTTIAKVEKWKALRPTWRVGQGHWFIGFHAGNVLHGSRGAVGIWGRNSRQYGRGDVISPKSGLWQDEEIAGFIPAQHGSGLMARLMGGAR
jgi:hypothetical protein